MKVVRTRNGIAIREKKPDNKTGKKIYDAITHENMSFDEVIEKLAPEPEDIWDYMEEMAKQRRKITYDGE